MKKMYFLFLSLVAVLPGIAQKETFDLITYSPPAGWKKAVQETSTNYTITDKQKNSWCQIFVLKSNVSKGSIEADFENEWQALIVKNYTPEDTPKINEIHEAAGWKIMDGNAKFIFNKSEAIAMLVTMSGYERCVSIVVITNSRDYFPIIQNLLASIELKQPETLPATKKENPQSAIDNNIGSVVGTWTTVKSDQDPYLVKNGVAGYIHRQYMFDQNGTYKNIIKTFSFFADIFLTRESGTYQINGNSITITPKIAVLETWSRKGGNDVWGKHLSSQNIPLEKITYQYGFETDYFGTHLVLQASQESKRDGPLNNKNRWSYTLPTRDFDFIKLPD